MLSFSSSDGAMTISITTYYIKTLCIITLFVAVNKEFPEYSINAIRLNAVAPRLSSVIIT
jgi:hypothetical protein